ncbi:hypothetical protein [Cohnella caldifontis]|uniref:hypothetical protein n=1 Tax=Cohnella caldifontis TaxID=3027471 RepID=UPI0023EDD00D|nr:hypothetical protein [Cohnella sp. YIM B05605]
MPYVGKGKNGTNSEGWLRDKDYYWKEVQEKYPESISKANKQRIELDFSPINDKQFREHFPQVRAVYTMLKKKQEFGVVIAKMLNY